MAEVPHKRCLKKLALYGSGAHPVSTRQGGCFAGWLVGNIPVDQLSRPDEMTPGIMTTACFFLKPLSASSLPILKSRLVIQARGVLKAVRLAKVADVKELKSLTPLSNMACRVSGKAERWSRVRGKEGSKWERAAVMSNSGVAKSHARRAAWGFRDVAGQGDGRTS